MKDLVLQMPSTPKQLIILLHGVGSCPEHLAPLGRAISHNHPNALVVAIAAPFSDQRGMLQWFSVQQITEANRPSRVCEAMPAFLEALEPWFVQAKQNNLNITLFGFSQGGIMLLEAAKTAALQECHILVCATRFASAPTAQLNVKKISWIHGQSDPLFPITLAQQAVTQLQNTGQNIDFIVVPNMQHELSTQTILKCIASSV